MNKIQIIFIDVDGTLTDGKIYMGANGEICKAFDIKDGYALANMLPAAGVTPVIITGRKSDIVKRRCAELGIVEVYQNCSDKRSKMIQVAQKKGIEISKSGKIIGSAYIGDDLIDVPGIEMAEVSGCPADAVEQVKSMVTYICQKEGGDGAVREFIEWLIDTYNS